MKINLKNYTASCFLVSSGSTSVRMDIYVTVYGKKADDLLMGMEGGHCVSDPNVQNQPGIPTFAHRTFPTTAADRKDGAAFVLFRSRSNDPANKDINYKIVFGVNKVKNNEAPPASNQPASKPSSKPYSSVRAKEHARPRPKPKPKLWHVPKRTNLAKTDCSGLPGTVSFHAEREIRCNFFIRNAGVGP